MTVFRRASPVDPRVVESVLAVLVFSLAAVFFLEIPIVVERSIVPWDLLIPATMIVPGLLALAVLLDALSHGVDVGRRHAPLSQWLLGVVTVVKIESVLRAS